VLGLLSTRWILAGVDDWSEMKLSSDITTLCTGTARTHHSSGVHTLEKVCRTLLHSLLAHKISKFDDDYKSKTFAKLLCSQTNKNDLIILF